MNSNSTNLPPDLIKAYKNTDFTVKSEVPFSLKIDFFNEHLGLIYHEYSVNTACFITAYNPFSETVSKTDNSIAQQRLLKDIAASELPYLDGIGLDPSGEWEGEPSFLILGISKNQRKCWELNIDRMQLFGVMMTAHQNYIVTLKLSTFKTSA